jgi:hypothetical protein
MNPPSTTSVAEGGFFYARISCPLVIRLQSLKTQGQIKINHHDDIPWYQLDRSDHVAILPVDLNTQAPRRNIKAHSNIGCHSPRLVFYEDYSGAQT